MAKGESPGVLRDIHTLFHVGTSSGLTDAQLLDRFRARSDRDLSESAFAGLMARHGPMVLGVCRRALRNPDDVADAFQATFLILVRQADTVRVEDSLGRWLYGVSRRVSVRAKLAAARRSAREVGAIEPAAAPAASADGDELRDVLDEEISRLPEKFRSAVVLCELEGLGHDEAARQLGCAVGTVKSRLSRAREKLRPRLIRRGIAPTAWALTRESASAVVPAKLIETTVQAAMGHVDGVISPAVALLIQGVLRAMLLKKLSMIAITVVGGLAVVSGVGVWARQAATHAAGEQAGNQGAEKKVGGEEEPGKPDHSTATNLGKPEEQDDDLNDRIESLRLDVQLLQVELQSRMEEIGLLNAKLSQVQLYDQNPQTQEAFGHDAKQSQIEALQKRLKDSRKEYISKSKELRHKQSELATLQKKIGEEWQRRADERQTNRATGTSGREATSNKPVPVRAEPSDATGLSPILEKRLSGIEGKLDNVLKAIEDLKREKSQ